MRPDSTSEQSGANLILKDLPKPQKIAVLFLAFLAIFIIVFWIWQMKTQINSPFTYQDPADSQNTLEPGADSASIALLKRTDTDGDGLSDYDELNVYHTSVYLSDSDSDGISDLKEIEQVSDPNCPQGQNCNAPIVSPSDSSSSNPMLIPDTSLPSKNLLPVDSGAASGFSSVDQTALQQIIGGQADAATLRQVFISNGISTKEELDQISDVDLLKSYQDTLNNQNT